MEKKKKLTAPKAIVPKTNKSAIVPKPNPSPKEQFDQLHDKMKNAGENPKFADLTAMRQLLLASPELLPFGWTIHDSLRMQMIESTSCTGASKALMMAEVDLWLRELGYESAPPLERIHMDTIATSRLRLLYAEFRLNAAIKDGRISVMEHYDQMLTFAQTRLNKAVESLSRIRLLATRAPVFQVNLATQGGQQINVAGDITN
jgi:hypothetical protein